MKNNYLILKTIFSFLLITSLVGCQDDFLETTPLSEVSDSSVWVSPVLAEAAVLDLYQGTWAGVFTVRPQQMHSLIMVYLPTVVEM